jgi:heme-binding protein
MIMKFSGMPARRRAGGISAGCLLGGLTIGIIAAPTAAAAPDCSPGGVNATVSSVTGTARQFQALALLEHVVVVVAIHDGRLPDAARG